MGNSSLNKHIGRFVEITIKVTSGFSTLICHHSVLIGNPDLNFVEFCLLFLIFFSFIDNFFIQIFPKKQTRPDKDTTNSITNFPP